VTKTAMILQYEARGGNCVGCLD